MLSVLMVSVAVCGDDSVEDPYLSARGGIAGLRGHEKRRKKAKVTASALPCAPLVQSVPAVQIEDIPIHT